MSPSHHPCLKICCRRWCLYLCLCNCICLGSQHYTRLCLIFVFVTFSPPLLEDLLQEVLCIHVYVFAFAFVIVLVFVFIYMCLSSWHCFYLCFYICVCHLLAIVSCCKTCLTIFQSFQSVKWHNLVSLFEVVQAFLIVFEATAGKIFVQMLLFLFGGSLSNVQVFFFVWKIFTQVFLFLLGRSLSRCAGNGAQLFTSTFSSRLYDDDKIW